MRDSQSLVGDSVDRMLALHAAAAMSSDFPSELWRAADEAGLAQVLAVKGGAFHSDVLRDAVTIVRRCAHAGAALPIAEAILATWLAARVGWTLGEGLATVSLDAYATPENGSAAARHLTWVPWGRHAVYVLALISDGRAYRIGRFDAPTLTCEHGRNLADEPRDALRFGAPAVISDMTIEAMDARALAAVLRAAQMTGAMEATLELALEHAKTRQQFGRPIGGFQAVQQILAHHAGQVAAATAAVDLAVDCWGTSVAVFHAGVAKSRVGEAAGIAAECAHQVIAAMGFAMEHPLQRFTRRLWSWRDEDGNEAYWNELIGAHVLAGGPAEAWPTLVAGSAGIAHP